MDRFDIFAFVGRRKENAETNKDYRRISCRYDSYFAFSLYFNSGDIDLLRDSRYDGYSVCPVLMICLIIIYIYDFI